MSAPTDAAPAAQPAVGGGPRIRPRPSTDARAGRVPLLPTAILLLGAFYCLVPLAWVVAASTKSGDELFTTFTFAPGTGFLENLAGLSRYRDGIFWQWGANTALYAGAGALLSAGLSGLTGYTLAKYRFPGRTLMFNLLLAGVLVPAVMLAIPQYLLFSQLGLADSRLSVLVAGVVSPYGIYLARIYAAAAVPDSLIEAARTEGAGEFRIFRSVALPIMVPGLVTVFLFQFVMIWNNFLLPYILLSDDGKFPITVGLFTLLNQGAAQPALYTLVITGSLLSIVPLVALFLALQRFWRIDLLSGAVK